MTRRRHAERAGFALLPVVLALALLGATAYLMTRESALGGSLASATQQRDRARYLAEAALRHADWQVQGANCSGFNDVPTTSFAGGSYVATVTPASGSPVTLSATGTLADGTSHTLRSENARAYQASQAVTLQLGPDAGKDAMTDSFYSTRNFGSASYVQVNSDPGWTQHPIIQFDLASLPPGVRVLSARLELMQRNVAVPGMASVHRITRDWVEGTKDGGGQADGATWHTYDGTNAWAQVGGDFEPEPYADELVTDATDGQWLAWEVAGLVEDWLAGRAANHGFLIRGDGVLEEAEFASQEASNPLDAPRLTITYSCECGQVCGAGGGTPLLFVVDDPLDLSAEEDAKKTLIESWDYDVTLIADGETQAAFDAALALNDVAYVSGDVEASVLGTRLTATPVGVVNEQIALHDELGFSDSSDSNAFDMISVVDDTHSITAGFSTGWLPIATSDQPLNALEGTLAPGLQTLATVWITGANYKDGLAVLEQGAQLHDGGTAAGRRAQLPWGATGFDFSALNADGETIMQRAIEWATGPDTGPIAHWKLDDGSGLIAVDSEGGHDGTLTTNGPAWVTGQIGDGLEFDGVDDHVDVGSLNPRSYDDFTIIAWYKSADSSVSDDEYIYVHDDSFVDELTFGPTDDGGVGDRLRLGINRGGSWDPHYGTSDIVDQEWHHLAAVRAGGRIRLYVDGAEETDEVDALAGLTVAIDGDGPFIGDYPGVTEQVHGVLDDVRLYDRGLTASEISDLFTAGGVGGGSGPVYESFDEYIDADNNSNAISVTRPAGTAAGELLVAVVVTNRNNESTLVADDPGWTLLARDAQANAHTVGVWWRVAGGSEPASYGFSWDAAAPARSYSWIMRFSGNDPTNPINVWDKFGEGSVTSPLSPAVTTTVDDTLILRIGGFDDDDITIGDPGMAGHTPITMQESNTGTGTVSGGAAYVDQAASGDSGTANFTLTASEQSRTITIGIAPAP